MGDYRKIKKRFVRSFDGHPVLLVGEGPRGYLGIQCTHSKKRGHSANRDFLRNPNPNDSEKGYWEARCIVLGPKDFIDYSTWSLSNQDEDRIDRFLKSNSRAKVYFQ